MEIDMVENRVIPLNLSQDLNPAPPDREASSTLALELAYLHVLGTSLVQKCCTEISKFLMKKRKEKKDMPEISGNPSFQENDMQGT